MSTVKLGIERTKFSAKMTTIQDVAVQSLSHVQLFATPQTAACQASLSLTISWSLPKFMSIALRKQEMRDCKGVKILLGMSLQPQERGPPTLMEGLLESETEPCGFSAEFAFFAVLVSSKLDLPLRWVFFTFCFYHGSFAELGSCCAWPLLRGGCFSQVKPQSRHHYVRQVYAPRFLSRHNKCLA